MMTHPDIAHSVAYLARFNANPSLEHWKALKHLFRYVKQLITNSRIKVIWPARNSSSPTRMPPIEIVLTLDGPLQDI